MATRPQSATTSARTAPSQRSTRARATATAAKVRLGRALLPSSNRGSAKLTLPGPPSPHVRALRRLVLPRARLRRRRRVQRCLLLPVLPLRVREQQPQQRPLRDGLGRTGSGRERAYAGAGWVERRGDGAPGRGGSRGGAARCCWSGRAPLRRGRVGEERRGTVAGAASCSGAQGWAGAAIACEQASGSAVQS